MVTYLFIGLIVMLVSHIIDILGSIVLGKTMTNIMKAAGAWTSVGSIIAMSAVRVVAWPVVAVISSISLASTVGAIFRP